MLRSSILPFRRQLLLALLLKAGIALSQCPASVSGESAVSTPATCPSNGTISVSSNVSGNPGATYQIVSGPASGGYQTTAQSSSDFTSLPPGTYLIRITCGSATTTVSATIANQYTPLSLNATVGNLCQNGQTGGTITASATGGNPGSTGLEYAFLYSTEPNADDALFTYSGSSVYQATAYGTYQVRVKDACNNFVTRTVEVAPLYPIGHLGFYATDLTCTSTTYRGNLSRADNGFPIDYATYPGYQYEIYDITGSADCVIPAGATPLVSKTVTQDSDLDFTLPITAQQIAIRTISPCGQDVVECYVPARNLDVSNGIIIPCGSSGTVNLLLWAGGTFTFPLTVTVTPQGGAPITHVVQSNEELQHAFDNIPYASSYTYTATDACGLTDTDSTQTPVPADGLVIYVSYGSVWCTNTVGLVRVDLYIRGYNAGVDGSTVQILDANNNVVYTNSSVFDGYLALPPLAPGTYTVHMIPANGSCPPSDASFTIGPDNAPPLVLSLAATTTQLCGGTGSVSATLTYNGGNTVTFELLDNGGNAVDSNLTGTFTNLPAGDYTVRATADYSDCGVPNMVASQTVTIQPAGTAPVVTKKLGVICENQDGSQTASGKAIFEFSGFGPFKVEMKKTTEPETAYVVKGTNVPNNFTADGLDAGTDYDVRITDQCGNTAVTQVSIGALLPLQLTSQYQPCLNQPYVLSVEDVIDATYSWEKDGVPIASSREITFGSYAASNDGTYVCTVVLAGGCVTRKVTVNLSSTACGNVVPVTLAYFRVRSADCGALLDWKTEKEDNFDYFLVERSTATGSSLNFAPVGKIPAAGQSSSYSFVQADLPAGTYYYRLKQVDKDGTFEYSKTAGLQVTCNGLKASGVQVYPNPARHGYAVQVSIDSREYRGAAFIRIYNAAGAAIAAREVTIGQQASVWNIGDLLKGKKGYLLLKVEEAGGNSLGSTRFYIE